MQVLAALAVILTVCCVHATVYFREEFSDGGKFAGESHICRRGKLHLDFLATTFVTCPLYQENKSNRCERVSKAKIVSVYDSPNDNSVVTFNLCFSYLPLTSARPRVSWKLNLLLGNRTVEITVKMKCVHEFSFLVVTFWNAVSWIVCVGDFRYRARRSWGMQEVIICDCSSLTDLLSF